MVKYIPKADTHDKDYSGYQMCKHQPQRIKKKKLIYNYIQDKLHLIGCQMSALLCVAFV